MKKCLMMLSVATLAVAMLAGCGKDVKGDAKPAVALALRELDKTAQCLEIKNVKKSDNEKNSFTATAVCEINGKQQDGEIVVRYKNDKPTVEILGFDYADIMIVKKGLLAIDKSRTVGDALAVNLEYLKWEKFVNRRNQNMIKASGIWKGKKLAFNTNNQDYYNYPPYGRDHTCTIDLIPGKEVEVFFTLNHDGSFDFLTGRIGGTGKENAITNKKAIASFLNVLFQ